MCTLIKYMKEIFSTCRCIYIRSFERSQLGIYIENEKYLTNVSTSCKKKFEIDKRLLSIKI